MWQIKEFKTRVSMNKWVEKNNHKIQWQEIFINNAYGLEYRKLMVL